MQVQQQEERQVQCFSLMEGVNNQHAGSQFPRNPFVCGAHLAPKQLVRWRVRPERENRRVNGRERTMIIICMEEVELDVGDCSGWC